MRTLAELGASVAQLRREQHLTQETLAAVSGTQQSYWSRFERGQVGEFGVRKLLSALDRLGYELVLRPVDAPPTLEDLLLERKGGRSE